MQSLRGGTDLDDQEMIKERLEGRGDITDPQLDGQIQKNKRQQERKIKTNSRRHMTPKLT